MPRTALESRPTSLGTRLTEIVPGVTLAYLLRVLAVCPRERYSARRGVAQDLAACWTLAASLLGHLRHGHMTWWIVCRIWTAVVVESGRSGVPGA